MPLSRQYLHLEENVILIYIILDMTHHHRLVLAVLELQVSEITESYSV